MKNNTKTHKERVAELVHTDEDLITKLFEPAPKVIRTGPSKLPYAEGKQKSIIYLSGTNLILLDKMLRLANQGIMTKRKGKETKSSILNRIFEEYFEINPDAFIPEKDK